MNYNVFLVPASIVVAGMIIASAIYLSSNNDSQAGINVEPELPTLTADAVELSDGDHSLGDADAPITIVEYSDMDCPFCTKFHATMKQVLDKYEGDVRWVYRHFPLESIHPNARTKALASECVATQLGNQAFWNYTDALFEQATPVGSLESLAVDMGADRDAFVACMGGSGSESQRINAHIQNAQQTGGQGTPWSLLINADGEVFPVNGAQPFSAVSAIIESNL